MLSLLLAPLLGSVVFEPASAASLTRIPIKTALSTQRCADGSMPIIYATGATDPAHANDWVIDLQGDGEPCWHDNPAVDPVSGVDMNATACSTLLGAEPRNFGTGCIKSGANVVCGQARGAMHVAGATPWPGTETRDGILGDTVSNNFAGWNRVEAVACTPDQWSGVGGRASLRVVPAGYTNLLTAAANVDYTGKHVLNAIFSFLETTGLNGTTGRHYLRAASAGTVLLAGSGTGAAGVVANLDRLATYLGAEHVRGVVDSEPTTFAFQNTLFDTAYDPEEYWDNPVSPGAVQELSCLHRAATGVATAASGGSPGWPSLLPVWCAWATGATSCDPALVAAPSRPGDESCTVTTGPWAADPGQCLRVSTPIAFGELATPVFLRQDLLDPDLMVSYDAPLTDSALLEALDAIGVTDFDAANPDALAHREECFQETVLSVAWSMARNTNVEGWFIPCGDEEMYDSFHNGLVYDAPFLDQHAGPPVDLTGDRDVSFNDLLDNWVEGRAFTRMARGGCAVHPLDPWTPRP